MGFCFFRGVGIPALGAEFTLLSLAELYLRTGGNVNNVLVQYISDTGQPYGV